MFAPRFKYFLTVPVYIFYCLVASERSCAETTTFQSSEGPCAVNIANVSGSVTVNSTCFDEKAIRSLLDTINQQSKDILEKVKDVQHWIEKYYELEKRLGSSTAFTELRAEAQRRYKKGDLVEAGRLLEEVIRKEEENVESLAADYYNRGEMLVLQLKPAEAQRFYEKAFRYRPEFPRYAEAYAGSLCDAGQQDRARLVFERSIAELRSLAQTNPAIYAANLSCALIDLAGLYFDTGNYERGNAIAQESLDVAHTIVPQNGKDAKEHIADALTSLGSIEAKRGNLQSAKQHLQKADEIYAEIGGTNSNWPSVFEALAGISGQEADRVSQERQLLRALVLSKQVAKGSLLSYRSRLAWKIQRVVVFYNEQRDLEKAEKAHRDFVTFVESLDTMDITSLTFLRTVAMVLRGELFLWRGNAKGAESELELAIRNFQSLAEQLRPRESAMYCLAYLKLGWAFMKEAEYQRAAGAFEAGMRVNRDVGGPELKEAANYRRLARFFVADFGDAARDFLASADSLNPSDRTVWEFLIRKRADPLAKLEYSPDEGKAAVPHALADASSGESKAIAALQELSVPDNAHDDEGKCRQHFFIGEMLLLLGEKASGLNALGRCVADREGQVYAWVMKAERTKWMH